MDDFLDLGTANAAIRMLQEKLRERAAWCASLEAEVARLQAELCEERRIGDAANRSYQSDKQRRESRVAALEAELARLRDRK